MTVEITTYMSTLMQLAHRLGQARLSGDPELIREAEQAHDAYRDLCLEADHFITEIPQ